MVDVWAEEEAEERVETKDELEAGTLWGIGRTIVSHSCCVFCVSDDVIYSTIEKGDALVTFDCSLVLEIEITISFNSLSYRLWSALLLFVQVKGFLTKKSHIYRHPLFLHVIIRWKINVFSITWDSHSMYSKINSHTWALTYTY